ncbi:Uncharacterised protein [Campylobacter jejuni subsp. doylei]|nr:Uncharacterised protein [Campylobacter jejuni subsp. doylei]VEJ47217.1 Uncharacterised protein [Campylobacter jejuni subsp. doylei]
MPKVVSELSSDKTIGIMPKNYDKLTITNYYNTQEQYNEAEQLGMFQYRLTTIKFHSTKYANSKFR